MINIRFYILVRTGAMCQNRMLRSNQLITSTPKLLRKFHSSKTSSVLRRPSSNEQQITERLNNLLVMTSSCKIKDQFHKFFPEILRCLKSSSTLSELPSMQLWIEKIVEYNLKGGKMNRGLAVVESFMIFKNDQISEQDIETAIALGWAVEMAFFLVADDIMDDSLTRRMKPCWYRTNNLGVKAFNDSILLESLIYQILSSYCKDRHYYLPILELFHDVTMRTSLGQAMDLHSTPDPNQSPDLSKFTTETYDAIVKYKTAYYSFYLPVAIAMRLSGIQDERLFKQAEDILLPMGRFFQVQDDYLDCFGDPEVTGKIGTDIEDGKCSWLIVTALPLCDSAQRQLIETHYASKDPSSVKLVKSLYQQLGIPKLYIEYEENSYKQLTQMIEGIKQQLPTSVFQGFMEKIYKRLN
ncbi:farnesyl pyrophosphate synthase-like isoform X2 [Daphnia pulicaria]|uniref:farnesyl pyrophosphate synthase-like isoform X2 n=1 Tax=Daphnia pulicaria TaxID=35523 RepID=UPI001EEBD049|nr:farnesyl pyrophosphate synthase-like isoform X2 [Daphnia pulicaria]